MNHARIAQPSKFGLDPLTFNNSMQLPLTHPHLKNRSARGSYFYITLCACHFTGHDLYSGIRTRWRTPLHATMKRSFERNPT